MNKIQEILTATLNQIQDAANRENSFVGVPSGLKDLDAQLCGFENSDLIVIGARPCMGKSAMMISMALNMAGQSIPVLFYSFEMSETQLMKRILTNITKIDSYNIERGSLDNETWEQLVQKSSQVSDMPLYIVKSESSNIEDFCKQVVKDVDVTKAKIIFIDYLQLFTTAEKYQNRYEAVAACTRSLKHLARELNLPFIVGSQINRNPEHRSTEYDEFYHPHMSDLRDSGTICEDANVVLLLDRPEVHLQKAKDQSGIDIKGALDVKIAKNHMGRQCTVRLKFYPEFCRVENWPEPEIPLSLSCL
ncbi:MAG: DnaB-like helicase C-terminal domain-containing protein [Bacteroides sp.]|nr:DnaB-like helicase C-terminal domain-containing protein [Bacteroides sp.]